MTMQVRRPTIKTYHLVNKCITYLRVQKKIQEDYVILFVTIFKQLQGFLNGVLGVCLTKDSLFPLQRLNSMETFLVDIVLKRARIELKCSFFANAFFDILGTLNQSELLFCIKSKDHRSNFLITSSSNYFMSKRHCLQLVNHMRVCLRRKTGEGKLFFWRQLFVQFKVKVQIFLKEQVSLVNI